MRRFGGILYTLCRYIFYFFKVNTEQVRRRAKSCLSFRQSPCCIASRKEGCSGPGSGLWDTPRQMLRCFVQIQYRTPPSLAQPRLKTTPTIKTQNEPAMSCKHVDAAGKLIHPFLVLGRVIGFEGQAVGKCRATIVL
jgi:hypothetical protein